SIEGRPAPPPEVAIVMDANVLYVGDRYIETMSVPIARGRAFTEQDALASRDGPKAAMINQTMARRYFPDQDPIGQRIAMGLPQTLFTPWMTIVGVVADVTLEAMQKEPYPAIYIPQSWSGMSLVVRAKDNPLSLAPSIRDELKRLDRDLLVYN